MRVEDRLLAHGRAHRDRRKAAEEAARESEAARLASESVRVVSGMKEEDRTRFFNQLYEDQRRREAKLAETAEKVHEEERKVYTARPSIDKRSREIAERLVSGKSFEERAAEQEKKRLEKV